MATIVTRAGKGSPLTNNEVDANFTNLNSDKLESGDTVASLTITTADINGGTIDGVTIGGASAGAATFTSATVNGNIAVTGTVDGRDVATDGTKLDGIEAGADVTDTTNVTAAGALMDSELTNITAVKALDQGVATTDSPSFAGITATTVDINGGTIDGTVIGGTTPAAISGTTGSFSGAVTGTDLTLSGGVVFGATGGSVTSKTLDDYEEGTWTPAAGAGTITVVDTPTYTKVGRWVFLTAVVTMPSQTNSSQAQITGLPFTPKQNGSNSEYGASIGEHNYGSYIEMCIHSSHPAIIFRPNGGSSASYTAVSGKNFRFTVAYLT